MTADMTSILKEHYELELLFSKVFTLQEEEESQAHTSKGSKFRGEGRDFLSESGREE